VLHLSRPKPGASGPDLATTARGQSCEWCEELIKERTQHWGILPPLPPFPPPPCDPACHFPFGFDFDHATDQAASGAAAVAEMNSSPITGADLPRNLPLPVLC